MNEAEPLQDSFTPGADTFTTERVPILGPDHFTLRLPLRPTSVTIGRRAAAQFAEEAGCSPPVLWRVRLAASEALSNAVLHAYPTDDDERNRHHLVLTAEFDGAGLAITVTDFGVGLRPRDDSPGLGVGLSIMARCADEFDVDPGAEAGTVVRMRFLEAPPADRPRP